MKIEIEDDRRSLYAFDETGRVLKRWPVLLVEPETDGSSWILFAQVKEQQMRVLAARAVFDAAGRLASFDRHIRPEEWKQLHALFRKLEMSRHDNGMQTGDPD